MFHKEKLHFRRVLEMMTQNNGRKEFKNSLKPTFYNFKKTLTTKTLSPQILI